MTKSKSERTQQLRDACCGQDPGKKTFRGVMNKLAGSKGPGKTLTLASRSSLVRDTEEAGDDSFPSGFALRRGPGRGVVPVGGGGAVKIGANAAISMRPVRHNGRQPRPSAQREGASQTGLRICRSGGRTTRIAGYTLPCWYTLTTSPIAAAKGALGSMYGRMKAIRQSADVEQTSHLLKPRLHHTGFPQTAPGRMYQSSMAGVVNYKSLTTLPLGYQDQDRNPILHEAWNQVLLNIAGIINQLKTLLPSKLIPPWVGPFKIMGPGWTLDTS
ncbi:hypothetical protein BDK51DRAFT_51352 [Blyttiomyces helicus]|uniref:Uncharacterized protein n=1 Tax=Blyttiomyces helicus TaxID=388810 RepID=A0A4P9VZZ2_9FUNG|nr:hypothetical protein BDK51DRAFT_51352 [Blyttiomyces helicus]|eukprot:RKO84615.1 hypothetical protein BDK51DRAFT_51352 [Blyttiomyces helicus]